MHYLGNFFYTISDYRKLMIYEDIYIKCEHHHSKKNKTRKMLNRAYEIDIEFVKD